MTTIPKCEHEWDAGDRRLPHCHKCGGWLLGAFFPENMEFPDRNEIVERLARLAPEDN